MLFLKFYAKHVVLGLFSLAMYNSDSTYWSLLYTPLDIGLHTPNKPHKTFKSQVGYKGKKFIPICEGGGGVVDSIVCFSIILIMLY